MSYDYSEFAKKASGFVEQIGEEAKKAAKDVGPILSDLAEKAKPAVESIKEKATPVFYDVTSSFSEKPHLNISDISRDAFMLKGKFSTQGYDWWWHSFTGTHSKTGEQKAFFVEYFVINPGLAEDEPVFGQLPENIQNGKKPSYVMIKAGAWGKNAKQIHRFFSFKDVTITPGAPYSLTASDCYASEGRITGSVNVSEEEKAAHPEWMSDMGRMKWSLSVDKKTAYNVGYGASRPVRDAAAFEMYWHAEGMKTEYSGTVEYNGELYYVSPESSFGYADKNWGADFTSPWIWLSSWDITSNNTGERLKNTVFDIGGGRPAVLGMKLENKLLGAIVYEGQEIEFNFSKAWMNPKTRFKCYETDEEVVWHIEQENTAFVMQTSIHCRKEDMLLINYEAPNGTKKHNRLWNGGNGEGTIRLYRKDRGERILLDVLTVKHAGCEWGTFSE